MATDYANIKADEKRKKQIIETALSMLAGLYADPTHFIFELLQNAEDALARRQGWNGSRAVSFTLSKTELRVAHYGQPFDGSDVSGICSIASTKDMPAIGRFGIGFQSVYAFTQRPEVHSGGENFAIENCVDPIAVPAIDRQSDETVFILPLDKETAAAHAKIVKGLQQMGSRTLLFLRQIEKIAWVVEGGPSGLYVRDKPEKIGENGRRIVLLGEEQGKLDEETWLLFSREAKTPEGAGHVEIAFSIAQEKKSIQPISNSPLVVFFPTVLTTHLGFLVQGPYRTTPSRDNVPGNNPWNQHLVQETATLLVEALRSLRDHGLLDVDALRSLPLDRAKFAEGSMFAPLFAAVREALISEPLLPSSGGGHTPAGTAKLARTQDLRTLFNGTQLAELFDCKGTLAWISGDITQNRTPELRQYLMRELDITEVTWEAIPPKLNKLFLSKQPNDWIQTLYKFLNSQPELLRQGRLNNVPLIRLEDGTQVVAKVNNEPQAFLPCTMETGFPTVRRSVCETEDARTFLLSLGLTEPDPVDDIVRNVLPKYHGKQPVHLEDYKANISRILAAFATDSKSSQREKLLDALRKTTFIMAVDAGNGSKCVSKPGAVYRATDRLKNLFAGVAGVLLVDDSYPCLRGEDVRELLEACGATRYLQPVAVTSTFTGDELRKMRIAAGCESVSSSEPIDDHTLRGLDSLLKLLPTLDATARVKKAAMLWEALGDVEGRGTGTFSGSYHWHYHHRRSTTFDAAFVRQLNTTAWVPDANGDLQHPEFVLFDTLGWKPNPFLLSKIPFKPPIIEALAKEAGIDPGILDLVKKYGITEAQLREHFGVKEPPKTPDRPHDKTPTPTPPVPDPSSGGDPTGSSGGGGTDGGTGSGSGNGTRTGTASGGHAGTRSRDAGGGSKRTPGSPGGRPFISYVGAHPHDEEPDPDGFDQQTRMALEEKAIAFIIANEPNLKRTPANNPGYDLFEAGDNGDPIRWIEVKAMTGGLLDRPVGLSHTQFECARKHGEAYWIYVVEHADDDGNTRIVRIHDPASKARTFTFDHGWLNVAEVDSEDEN